MRLTYAGCNLFGQVPASRALAIGRFLDLPIDDDLVDLALGHSINVYLRKSGVFFHGHGLHPKITHQVTRPQVPSMGRLVKVRTCDTCVYVLDDDGVVFALDFLARTPSFVPRLLKKDAPGQPCCKVVDFVPGTAINVGITDSGELYNFPKKLVLPSPTKKDFTIVKLSVGYEHCLILDSNGCVYALGNGRRGQLGIGTMDIQEEPKHIALLDALFIVDISCGGWHSMALSRDGDVYIWGWNSDGQLGILDEDGEPIGMLVVPQYLPFPVEHLNIKYIAAGGRHSICITKDNTIYAFGCNKFNQLGVPDFETIVNKPTKVHEIPKEWKILQVECGPSSTAIVLDNKA